MALALGARYREFESLHHDHHNIIMIKKHRVAILTSTYNTDMFKLDRCIRSVQWQTYGIDNIDHYICHDGPNADKQAEMLEYFKNNNWQNVKYFQLSENTNSYGASIRQFLLDTAVTNHKYVVHLDDDNLLFPEFVQEHYNVLEQEINCDFSVCKIVHLGPLPEHLLPAPAIISGIPPVFRNIDTLQVMVKTQAMRECKWDQRVGRDGYFNDGYTYDRLGKMFKWAEISKLLAIHL